MSTPRTGVGHQSKDFFSPVDYIIGRLFIPLKWILQNSV
jgi:hypothetical protein